MAAGARNLIAKATSLLEQEQDVLELLHADVQATRKRLDARHPGLQAFLDGAHGYAVFPAVGKAALVIGGAFGKGEVFAGGRLVGYAGVVQLTLGVQLGGETFTQIVAFENKQALDRFKAGKLAFAATASAALLKAGAATSADYENGVAVLVYSDGGLMLELALGAQKFIYKPAALGRLKKPTRSRPAKPAAPAARRRASTATNPKGRRKGKASQRTE